MNVSCAQTAPSRSPLAALATCLIVSFCAHLARAEEPATQATTGPAATRTAPTPPDSERVAGRKDDGPLTLRTERSGGGIWLILAYALTLLLLAGVAVFVAKRFLPRLFPKLGLPGGKNVSVVETVHLGPRKTVHVLRVGRRKYLVGGTREQLSMLADVTDAFEAGSFEKKLRQQEGKAEGDAG